MINTVQHRINITGKSNIDGSTINQTVIFGVANTLSYKYTGFEMGGSFQIVGSTFTNATAGFTYNVGQPLVPLVCNLTLDPN